MKKDSKPLEGMLTGIIKDLGTKERFGEEEIAALWADVAGEKAARHTRPVSLKKGSLVVNVDGSSWLYELSVHKGEILKKIEEKFKGRKIKEIRLRIGDIK